MTDVQRHEFPSWVKDMVAEVPGIQLDPIPHSVLPHPFEEYCLTPWIPSDVPQLVSIINHPESQMFGWRLNGGVAIDQDVMRKLEEGRTERWRHFPLCSESCERLVFLERLRRIRRNLADQRSAATSGLPARHRA